MDRDRGERMNEKSATREAESEAALSRIPMEESWGFCASGDGPPAAGGVLRGFFWFDTANELLSFVSRHIAWLDLQPLHVDVEPVHARVQDALAPFLEGRGPVGLLPTALNHLLEGLTQIEWAGQLGVLSRDIGDTADGWEAAEGGMAAVVIVLVEPAGERLRAGPF